MEWQLPLPVIATVVDNHNRQADDVIRLFKSLALFGGTMAGVDRVAYFVGEISQEPAERLAELGVVLKVRDATEDEYPGASLIPALLDSEETGFLIALAPNMVVRGDFADWVNRAACAVVPDFRGLRGSTLSLSLLGADNAAALPLYDEGIILVRREMAADLGSRWRNAMPDARRVVSEQITIAGVGPGQLALSLALAGSAMETLALPADFVAPADRPVPASSKPAPPGAFLLRYDACHTDATSGDMDRRLEEPLDLPVTARHMTPNFDNQAFWNHRYRHDPQRGSGIGSRGTPRALKESLISQALERHHARSVLDVGCGDLASVTGLSIPEYVGIDISEEVVAANAGRRPDWRFLAGDFIELYERNLLQAELVLCFDVLIHQHEFGGYEAFVRRLVQSCCGVGLVGAFQAPPRAGYRSEITAYHEPITRTLARVGATNIRIIASYRDTVVAEFRNDVPRAT